jgi:hypothetical protein
VKDDEMGGACSMGQMRNVYKIFVGKCKGRPIRRQRHRWEDTIKIDLREIG